MSWQVRCIENSVKITKKLAKKIYEVQRYEGCDEGEFFCEPDDVIDEDGCLRFNSGHCEHQDFLLISEEIVDVLKKGKVEGRIVFLDIEQCRDPYGDWWCHEFDGKGGYRRLRGKPEIVWGD